MEGRVEAGKSTGEDGKLMFLDRKELESNEARFQTPNEPPKTAASLNPTGVRKALP